ncbi:glutaminase [Cyclobacteriaceae bacterium]|nr:glutaminase [Cyclobacteriaceae bacterium]
MKIFHTKKTLLVLLICLTSQQLFSQELKSPQVKKVLKSAFNTCKDSTRGANASYIQELASVDPNIYGIAIVMADGRIFTIGDTSSRVSIQSVSKVFTLAKVIEEKGAQLIQDSIGVDATGEVFNSIDAIERMKGNKPISKPWGYCYY